MNASSLLSPLLLVPHWSCSKFCIVNPTFLIEAAVFEELILQVDFERDSLPCIMRPEQRLDFSTTRVSPASLNWDCRTYLLGRCLQEKIGFQSERTSFTVEMPEICDAVPKHLNGWSQQQFVEHLAISQQSKSFEAIARFVQGAKIFPTPPNCPVLQHFPQWMWQLNSFPKQHFPISNMQHRRRWRYNTRPAWDHSWGMGKCPYQSTKKRWTPGDFSKLGEVLVKTCWNF